MAIAWMYRDQYAAAGLRMLPGSDPTGRRTAAVMTLTAGALVPCGLFASAAGVGGWVSAAGAAALGLFFLWRCVGFARQRTDREARRVLRASLLYLPGVFALLLLDAFLVK
jgi:protoheme IX farnesyltransferase